MRQRVTITKFFFEGPHGPPCFITSLRRVRPGETAKPPAVLGDAQEGDEDQGFTVLDDVPITDAEAEVLSYGGFPPRVAAMLGVPAAP